MDTVIRDKIYSFLKEQHVCVIATVMPDGVPHASVMHYSVAANPIRLFFSTHDLSVKVNNALVHHGMAVAVGWSEETWITVQMRGQVTAIQDSALAKAIHYTKHPNSLRVENDPHTVIWAFTPKWLRAYL